MQHCNITSHNVSTNATSQDNGATPHGGRMLRPRLLLKIKNKTLQEHHRKKVKITMIAEREDIRGVS